MLKQFRLLTMPTKLNYCVCPLRRQSQVEWETPPIEFTMSTEMRQGFIQAYRVLVADYNDHSKRFKDRRYISPRLGYTMDALRENIPIVLGTVQNVTLSNHLLADGYVEEQCKIGGLYSKEEVFEQLIAGFCGPESPMWHRVPQKEVIDVRYTTTCQRDDVLQFERDFDKDGEWVLANINGVV